MHTRKLQKELQPKTEINRYTEISLIIIFSVKRKKQLFGEKKKKQSLSNSLKVKKNLIS